MAENNSAADGLSYDPNKNYDEETLALQREIDKEITASQLLIGNLIPLSDIEIDYAAGDPGYIRKLQDLKQTMKSIRKTRGDGNCFYRAFGFAYLETLLENEADLERFKNVIIKSKEDLVALGYPQFTIEDFHDTFMDVVGKVEKRCHKKDLLEVFNNQGLSDYIVVYLRLLVSGFLQKESDFYSNFIEGDRTMKEFCNQEVEPMGKESDHIHITALTSAVGVGVKVIYLDRAGEHCNEHLFPEGTTPAMTLIYKPGHYDIIYK